jgi:hypothetical protein
MGTNCSYHKPPERSNHDVQGILKSEGFCASYSDNKSRAQYCENIGGVDPQGRREFAYHSRGDSCYYSDSDGVTDFGFGCCNGVCGISGASANCIRAAYLADETVCCLRDITFNGSSPFDRKDLTQALTCSPECRDATSEKCQMRLYDYCTTGDMVSKWSRTISLGGETFNSPCRQLMQRNIESNTKGFHWASRLVNEFLTRTDLSRDSPMTSILYDICKKQPTLCQKVLKARCSNLSQETIGKSAMRKWCGCYLPDNEYELYTNTYRIPKECTPICNNDDNILLPSDDGMSTKTCTNSVCVIDNVAISMRSSNVGTINFSQLCGGCRPEDGIRCTCVLTNSTYNITNSLLNNVDLSQSCSGKSKCYSTIDGKSIEVDCVNGSPKTSNSSLKTLLIICAVITLIVCVIVYLLSILPWAYTWMGRKSINDAYSSL